MGRCNNRRAQERALQERNVPSRARFSQQPSSKPRTERGNRTTNFNAAKGTIRECRGNVCRDTKESVVQNMQGRVQQHHEQQQMAWRRPLDGIHVSKLDSVTLSKERVISENSITDKDYQYDKNEKHKTKANLIKENSIQSWDGTFSQSFHTTNNILNHVIDKDHEYYDSYAGDYDDEPNCQRGDLDVLHTLDKTYLLGREDEFLWRKHILENDVDDKNKEATLESDNEEKMINSQTDNDKISYSSIFQYFTEHYSFTQCQVLNALKASHQRIRLLNEKRTMKQHLPSTQINDNQSAYLVESIEIDDLNGGILEMALDWLSLHLEESDLRRGFHVQSSPKPPSSSEHPNAISSTSRTATAPIIKAIPHESISVLPKLTQLQYKREKDNAVILWQRQQLLIEFVGMGFHPREVEEVMASAEQESVTRELLLSASTKNDCNHHGNNSENVVDSHPLFLIMSGKLFEDLISKVELQHREKLSTVNLNTIDQQIEEVAFMERNQEREALEAIYAERFHLFHEHQDRTKDMQYHYRIQVRPNTPLMPPALSHDGCVLHIITRNGYPITNSPLLWFVNSNLPPPLVRRINIYAMNKASELIGQGSVFDLIEYFAENVANWQKEYILEESRIGNVDNYKELGENKSDEDDEDETDYYTTHFTSEERKKLSRRQRQKLRAAEKSHSREQKLIERQRLKERKDDARREIIRIENSSVSSRMADRLVERRWKEWVEEEAEKAARKAMNDAFLRNKSREYALEAARTARLERMRFHGELCDDEVVPEKNTSVEEEKRLIAFDEPVRACENLTNLPAISSTPSGKNKTPSKIHEPTLKTMLFVEKLRALYEEKAREKYSPV